MNWNSPEDQPMAIGEYHTALDTTDVSPNCRRYWNGVFWSAPYMVHWDEETKKRLRSESSLFKVHWRKPLELQT